MGFCVTAAGKSSRYGIWRAVTGPEVICSVLALMGMFYITVLAKERIVAESLETQIDENQPPPPPIC